MSTTALRRTLKLALKLALRTTMRTALQISLQTARPMALPVITVWLLVACTTSTNTRFNNSSSNTAGNADTTVNGGAGATAPSTSLAQLSARPQLSPATAARHRVADYLAQGPAPWQPMPVDARRWKPDFTVAADGSGTHRTVQAAVDAVPSLAASADGASPASASASTAASGSASTAAPASASAAAVATERRWIIHIRPGVYRGPLCVRGKPALTLYGTPGDARAVTLVDGRYNGLPKRPGLDTAQPCHPNLAAATHGTSGSATAVLASPDTLLAHLTIANDATDNVDRPEGAQAVALMTVADRIQLEDLRLVSHQDTFYVKRPAADAPARVFVRGSLIEGDVDFVFGSATLVIDDSTLLSRAGRLHAPRASGHAPARGGHVLAPSTPANVPLGFLVQRSRFVAEEGVPVGSTSLGRAWDEGVPPGQWRAAPGVATGVAPAVATGVATGVAPGKAPPNGQALVRDSALGPHISAWAASTARRPFRAPSAFAPHPLGAQDADANRLFEFANWHQPAEASRQVLGSDDGWASRLGTPAGVAGLAVPTGPATTINNIGAAAARNTTGGANAAPNDVHWARSRAELAAALKPQAGALQRPRIVKLLGRINLSEDDAGRPLGAEDYRDPAFSWAAFEAAFDPARWGRRAPEGPLEAARQASARAQAARVLLKVPSNTTLIGIGPDAQIVNGGLVLDGASNVILRNLHLRNAHDHFPAWDPKDNAQGEWNSEYDNLTLRGATQVWVDHCTFDDGEPHHAEEPVIFSRPLQRHDGLLDITRGANHITVSWNHFRQHGKTSLVGGSDRHLEDEGRLKVTFHHNLWEQTRERSPRVRYGQVHLANNLYVVHDSVNGAATGAVNDDRNDANTFSYSIGVGHRAAVLSQHNAWEMPPGLDPKTLLRRLGNGSLHDQGSLINGAAPDWPALLRPDTSGVAAPPSWAPPYTLLLDSATEVPQRVRAGAGAGRLWTAVALHSQR